MVKDLSYIGFIVEQFIGDYRNKVCSIGECASPPDFDLQAHPSWWNNFFIALDGEIDHRKSVETRLGKIDYLGEVGEPKLRQYIVSIETNLGTAVIDYTTGDSPVVRVARVILGSSVYLVRNYAERIIDYPLASVA